MDTLEELRKNGITITLNDSNKTKIHFTIFQINIKQNGKIYFKVNLPQWVNNGGYHYFEYNGHTNFIL